MTKKANSLLEGFNDLFKRYPYVAIFMLVVFFQLDVDADNILKRVTKTDVVNMEDFDTLKNDVHDNKEGIEELNKTVQELKKVVDESNKNDDKNTETLESILKAVKPGGK